MLANKKAQAMIIDLILLIIISSIFFIYLSRQTSEQSINAGAVRSQSAYVQNLLMSTLNYKTDENATIAELIGMNYCGNHTRNKVNASVNYVMEKLNKPDYYFIFTACADGNCSSSSLAVCSEEVSNKYGSCCVKTEKINIALFNLTLPGACGSHENVMVSLGIWPKSMEVKKC